MNQFTFKKRNYKKRHDRAKSHQLLQSTLNSFMHWQHCVLFSLVICFSLFPAKARSQARMDLDELNIKGELLNDNRLRFSGRDPQKITDRVSYRDNFRKEITDVLEVNWPEPMTPDRATGKVPTNGIGP